LTCDDGKFFAEVFGKIACYACPVGASRVEYDYDASTAKCFPEDEQGCVSCPAGKQLLCSDGFAPPWLQYASACDCYDASAMNLLVPTCVAGDAETVATERAIPSEEAATVTECSGNDYCECDNANQGNPEQINGADKCVKCPGDMQQWDRSVPTCYSCPAGQVGPIPTISGLKCFECADGATMVQKLVPSIITSDKLRCSKPNTLAPTTTPPPVVAEVAPRDSKFFVTM
jgi:hypothetical protein